MKEKPIIALTMGDPAGIGPEVIIKSLSVPEVRDVCFPIIIGSVSIILKTADFIRSGIPIIPVNSFENIDLQSIEVSVLNSTSEAVRDVHLGHESKTTGEAAARAINRAVELATDGKVNAIVTGPTSKHALHLAGYTYPGQTEFLADLTGTDEVVMMLVSQNLKVALVTSHCSISEISSIITKEIIVTKLLILNTWLQNYFGVSEPKIAVCALNPHAGDGGIFGREECDIIGPAIEEVQKRGIDVLGPFPADALFAHSRLKSYDAYLAMYHDQGLIPLKMDAFGKGVNVTLGLPIIRTSPDHGTAFDIAGQGIADPGSMIEAIKLAANMAKKNP